MGLSLRAPSRCAETSSHVQCWPLTLYSRGSIHVCYSTPPPITTVPTTVTACSGQPGFDSRQRKYSSLRHNNHTGFGVYPAPNSMDNRVSLPGSKAAGARSWLLSQYGIEVLNTLRISDTPPSHLHALLLICISNLPVIIYFYY